MTDFIKGRKNSLAIELALCKILGYQSFDALLAASNGHLGGAA
jgi:hypothetical protein